METKFLIQGSSLKPYELYFFIKDYELKSICKCPAGRSRTLCKHVTNFLEGDVTNVVSDNHADIKEVIRLFERSKTYSLFSNLRDSLEKKQQLTKFFKADKDKRRKELPLDTVTNTLENAGFLMMISSDDYLLFDCNYQYQGSIRPKSIDTGELISVKKNVRKNNFTRQIKYLFVEGSYPYEVLTYELDEKSIKQEISELLLHW